MNCPYIDDIHMSDKGFVNVLRLLWLRGVILFESIREAESDVSHPAECCLTAENRKACREMRR
jgi:hypothetical protein